MPTKPQTKRGKAQDMRKTSKNTLPATKANINKWKKAPNRIDIQGVDTKQVFVKKTQKSTAVSKKTPSSTKRKPTVPALKYNMRYIIGPRGEFLGIQPPKIDGAKDLSGYGDAKTHPFYLKSGGKIIKRFTNLQSYTKYVKQYSHKLRIEQNRIMKKFPFVRTDEKRGYVYLKEVNLSKNAKIQK